MDRVLGLQSTVFQLRAMLTTSFISSFSFRFQLHVIAIFDLVIETRDGIKDFGVGRGGEVGGVDL